MQVFLVLLFCGVVCYNAVAAGSRWSILRQSDYDVKLEIARADSVNSSYVKYIKLDAVPYNRTLRVLNASAEYLHDLNNEVTVLAKTYKFLSNEYRYFPITFEFNLCDEYKYDSFGLKQLFDSSSNIRPCPLKKSVHYHLDNGLPDYSKFPPHIPFGRYQVELDLMDRNNKIMTVVLNLEFKEKPKNWKL